MPRLSNNVLLTADWHLRATPPRCFKGSQDEWWEFQKWCVRQVFEIGKAKGVFAVWQMGDLFNTSNEGVPFTNEVLGWLVELTKDFGIMGAIAGNHDLLYHDIQNLPKSSIYTLFKSGVVSDLSKASRMDPRAFYHFNVEVDEHESQFQKDGGPEEMLDILGIHRLVMPPGLLPSFVKGFTADQIASEFPNTQLIVCGDVHKGFAWDNGKQVVLVPGCLNIQNIDLESYIPAVYICGLPLESERPTLEKVELPTNSISIREKYYNFDPATRKTKDDANTGLELASAFDFSSQQRISFLDEVRKWEGCEQSAKLEGECIIEQAQTLTKGKK
jgi:hypothetical protein